LDLKLIPVTAANWREAVFLTTDPQRKIPLDEKWIANNAFSLLQCIYDEDWDCRLLVDGETAVGFAFIGYDRDEDRYLLCRYMIDVDHQNKGYGKAFLPMVVDLIRKQYGCLDVYTSVHDENAHALHLYTSFGFERTEAMDADERVYVLRGGSV
jgi:diamine N-acetyltransferase